MKEDLSERMKMLSTEQLASLIHQVDHQQYVSALRPFERNTLFFELSFAQQRLWFLDQLVPESPAYNVPLALLLRGKLHIAALERSLNEIVHRHEVLRTTFITLDNQPRQVITPALVLSLTPIDLEELSTHEKAGRVRQIIDEEAARQFNLAQGPVVRARLLRLAPEEHVFLLTMHHIASDGWSIGILVRELATLYEAFLTGKPSPLPTLSIQYVDFARWQRLHLQGDVLEAQLAYWRQQLAGAPLALDLPTDHPRPAVQTFRGTKYFFTLEKALLERLKLLSTQEQATLFMTLLTGFKILLARYSGQETIMVGSAIANRNQVEIEGLIGFFVNILILRTDLSAHQSVRQTLQTVKAVTAGAYTHQDLPFEKIVEALQPTRDMSRMPLCQVSFLLQNAPRPQTKLAGLELTHLEIQQKNAKFDLTLDTTEIADGLACCFEYSSDLFEEATIRRMAAHWRNLLIAMVADPERPIYALPMLSEAEYSQVITQWNKGDMSVSSSSDLRCMHQIFEERVRQAPAALAVIDSQQQLSYQDLNWRANQLAHFLQQRGVGPEVCVGICVEKSVDMLVAVLGVLKAGGAYIPLDANYPEQRLHYLLCETQIPLLLTQQPLLVRLPSSLPQVICLDADWPAIAQTSIENPQSEVALDNLCYVIYTSGSSGHPKGVLLHHRGLTHLCQAQIKHFGLTAESRVLQFASFNFDASVSEIFTTLGAGATLYIERQDDMMPGPALAGVLRRHAITTLTCSPAALGVLPEGALDSVQVLISAGEVCSADLVERWSNGRVFLNAYGPTEATVCTTIARCWRPVHIPPIGKPMEGVQVYVLDAHMQPQPVGVPGELYIAGTGLARGYFKQPALTAERFLPNPYASGVGERLYRTGDQVRWLPDGELEYLGRLDQQLKVRGFRIEPGEIEYHLSQLPFLRTAAVVVQGERSEDRYLAAYLIPEAGTQPAQLVQLVEKEQMAGWQNIFEETFRHPIPATDPTFEIAGWNSSYNDQPLPAEDMHAWVDATIARLMALHPSHVLEIGCGSGLLLYRLLPSCKHYIATDFSPAVLGRLRQHLEMQGDLDKVTLLQRGADDFSDFSLASLDTVILNSVVQYFPSIEYLLTVLEGALALVRTGGQIFVGDVRNLVLHEAFCVDVELERAPAGLPLSRLQQHVEQRIAQENELLLDPAFFLALTERFPRLSHVQILLKHGNENELTRFRYDVILHVGKHTTPPRDLSAPYWHDWQMDGYKLTTLQQTLQTMQPELLVMSRIPDQRTLSAVLAATLLKNASDQFAQVADLRHEVQHALQEQGAVDPEEIWRIGQAHNYQVDIIWGGERAGRFDAVLRQQGSTWEDQPLPEISPLSKQTTWQSYANHPIEGRLVQQFIAQARAYIKERLPEYMLPSAFLVLPSLPLSPNGKLDRHALPQPQRARRTAHTIAPQTETERKIAAIWQGVLQVEQVDMDENFFDLGGHSLRMAQLHTQLRKTFEKDIPLIELFHFTTVRTQARYFHQPAQQTQAREEGRSRAQNRRASIQRQTRHMHSGHQEISTSERGL